MFELDATGTVLHYSPPSEKSRETPAAPVVGRNFFLDLVPLAQVQELRSRFLAFMADGHSVERFTLSFPYNQGSVKVQIVMAHLTERSERGIERFALVRLMLEARDSRPLLADA